MLYTLVWVAIFLIPFMNAQLMSEHEIDFNKVIISWVKVAPYFTIFLVNNILLAPKLLLRHRYWLYSIMLLVMLFSIFGTIEILDFRYWQSIDELRDKASFTDLAWYWNVLLGVFMAGANSMIKLYYRALDTERRMAVLEKQNIETQMEYLKYQINPHFLMNTLNNIHSLIDFDADMARKSVMELSHMLRHILYDSSESSTTLDKEITFLESYIKLMRIRYIDEVNITFSHPDIPAAQEIQYYLDGGFPAERSETAYEYDSVGNLLRLESAHYLATGKRQNFTVTEYIYDGIVLSKEVQTSYDQDNICKSSVTKTFDIYGVVTNFTTLSSSGNTYDYAYTYDEEGRVASELMTTRYKSAPRVDYRETAYEYHENGHHSSVTVHQWTSYDEAKFPYKEKSALGTTTVTKYDENGNKIKK